MNLILLGETRNQAITRVQERLGSKTPRPLAEQTFWDLAKKGKITMNKDNGFYLIEAEIDDNSMKNTATSIYQHINNRPRSNIRHFPLHYNNIHTHHPRVVYVHRMNKNLSTSLAPSLDDSEGYTGPDSLIDDIVLPPHGDK